MNTFEVTLFVGQNLRRYIVGGVDELDAQENASRLAALDYPRCLVCVVDVLYMGASAHQSVLPGVA